MKQLRVFFIFAFVFSIMSDLTANNTSQAYLEELKMLKRIYVGFGNREEAQKHYNQAMGSHKEKKYNDSEKFWYIAAKIDPSWVEPFFNLACATALQGKHEIAVEYVEIALSMDRIKVFPWAQNDKDLAGLRKNKKFIRLVEHYNPENHWVKDLLNKKFVYTHNDAWYNERRETTLRPDGTMEVKGRSSDTVPCDYSFYGGKWSFQNGGLTIIVYRKGGCADAEGTLEKSKVYNPASKDDFLNMFSGDHNPYQQGQDK